MKLETYIYHTECLKYKVIRLLNMKKQSIISRFAHRISVLKNVAEDELADAEWEEFAVCFAEVQPVCDNKYVSLEGISFGDVITEEYFHFRTRYIKNITKEMRISFHERTFEIKRIINHQEKDRMLSIIALEV